MFTNYFCYQQIRCFLTKLLRFDDEIYFDNEISVGLDYDVNLTKCTVEYRNVNIL